MGEPGEGSSLQEKTRSFLSEFFAAGEALVRELVEENERLRAALGEKGVSAPPVEAVPPKVAETLLQKIDRLEAECAEIRAIAGRVRRVSGSYRARLDQLEQEHFQLAAVHVAANQLHAAVTLEDVFRTITEILLNFVGIGAFTLYGRDDEENVLFPVFREGNEGAPASGVLSLEDGGDAAVFAELSTPWRRGDPVVALPGSLLLLPLVGHGGLRGLVRLERFLPQKNAFDDHDHGLLELVSEQGGMAIENVWARIHGPRVPMTRKSISERISL